MGHATPDPLSTRTISRRATSAFYLNLDTEPRVTGVEWLEDGVSIAFNDGRIAVLSAALLYASLPVA